MNVPPAHAGEPTGLEAGRVGGDAANIATSMMKILRPGRAVESTPGAIKIGRANDNDIVIPEVLASRHHATLIPTPHGTEIHDNRSINGTFVNGARVDSAVLHDGDVVTIGNIDLVFAGGTLVRRDESATATRTGGLDVRGVTWTIENNKTLLDDISLGAQPGTLTAVIGPSGAGKSTFARLVAGYTHPTRGTVAFEGHNVHAEYASLRSRIGMVPQDDVVHGQLTVQQALMYAAELRLPPDTTKDDRAQVVARVLEELEMTQHLHTRVDKLSGGQRKRASVALELLTGPSLLILDEPTSGLDPALDRQVMTMLRQLADAGRVVLVVTHSLTYLDVCDQVLLLAPGGKTAFCGPPSQIGPAMGTTNWADIFSTVANDPDGAKSRYLARTGPTPPPPPAQQPADLGDPSHTSLFRQFSTIARRQVRLIFSDRGYFVFLAVLPFIMGSLSMSVPGNVGFGIPNPYGAAPNEPGQILVLLNVGAVFMGTALTIRDLIGERPIFLREQAVGLSTSAYLLAKVCVYTVFAVIQSAIVTVIVLIGKGGPTQGAVALGRPGLELFADVALTCVASAMLGLALSAIAKSNEQIMPLLVVAVMSQLVFSGGMIPVTGRLGLDQMSWVDPGALGVRGVGLHRRPGQIGARSAQPEGLPLASHGGRVVVRHGHAGGHQCLLPELRPLEDPAQGRLTPRRVRLLCGSPARPRRACDPRAAGDRARARRAEACTPVAAIRPRSCASLRGGASQQWAWLLPRAAAGQSSWSASTSRFKNLRSPTPYLRERRCVLTGV